MLICAVNGKYHQKLKHLIELDFSGRAELQSTNTPIFELASFGGSKVVRGFRTDEALGRKLWSLQSEVWLPFFFINADSENKISKLLVDNFRIAPFVDVGGIYKTNSSFTGTRAGTGVGIRFIKNPITFKLDWAYGLGDFATPQRRSKFYFEVETNLPF